MTFNEKTLLPKLGLSTNFFTGTSALIFAISFFLNAIILSSMVMNNNDIGSGNFRFYKKNCIENFLF